MRGSLVRLVAYHCKRAAKGAGTQAAGAMACTSTHKVARMCDAKKPKKARRVVPVRAFMVVESVGLYSVIKAMLARTKRSSFQRATC